MNNHNANDASRDPLLGQIMALLWVVVIALVVTSFYFASSLCITVLLARFLAILVESAVALLDKVHVPRAASAALVVFGMILVSATFYVSYEKGVAFVDALPQYAGKIRNAVEPIASKMQPVQESAGKLTPTAPASKKIPEVRISERRAGHTWRAEWAR